MADIHRVLRRLRRRRNRNQNQHRVPVFRRLQNPLQTLPDADVFERFRFRPCTIMYILSLIRCTLERPTHRSQALSPLTILLCSLRFFATGSFYTCIGDTLGLSEATVSRCVTTVASSLCRLSNRFIIFPTGQALKRVKQDFFALAGFPNVAGCVDGTFVRLQAPCQDEQDYVNRKGYHSLNCQMTCDAGFKITSCVAKWPGSCHDARMFRDSNLRHKFENGTYEGFLLSDSAYPTRQFLMTPYNNALSQQQQNFNNALCRTRVTIEQTYGILKRRFSCLHTGLRVSPNRAAQVIIACVVLHNIGIEQGDIIDHDNQNLGDEGNFDINYCGVQDGAGVRDHICRTFF
ncbi:putative nuclease HARBI1 [Mizuhopecten yessoensis]|uniref:putative nuclease HARBI1 n=1 Tax=Mizuhopecten yessoensis TaxID=6573 RepID=UPI000B45B46B|nr:putative nuclease HARBI1 [Mizuhopecten yessoensis]